MLIQHARYEIWSSRIAATLAKSRRGLARTIRENEALVAAASIAPIR